MRKIERPLVTCIDGLPDLFILTTADVAAITDSSVEKVGEMLATGKIPGMFRFGTRMRIYVKDFKAHLHSQTVGYGDRMPHFPERRRGFRKRDAESQTTPPSPAELSKYERRMRKLVADGHLDEAEANILNELKATG